ncbi:hypothetical protein SESBI_32303 [Sesbania bispinosa]|nr:hypothetical protein SESBI_32303 [Sesbania bispinosa]
MEDPGAGESEEQLQRSTKKVKTRNEGGEFSFKDTLMNTSVFDHEDSYFEDEPYSSGESSSSDKESDEDSFDHCPEIKVSPKEFEKWCKPWQDSLVVRFLGKKISFQTMSTRLQNYWARDAQNQEGLFGPWMLVKKPQRRRQIRDNSFDAQGQFIANEQGSRFNVLNEEYSSPSQPMPDPVAADQRRVGKGPISQGAPNKDPKKNHAPRTVLPVSQPPSSPALETLKPQIDKSEEKGVLALMKQFQKKAKDSYDSSKSIFTQESLLPDNETLQFLANQHRRLKLHPLLKSLLTRVPLSRNLDSTKSQLKTWNEKEFGSIFRRKRNLLNRWVPSLEALQDLVVCDMIDSPSAKVSEYAMTPSSPDKGPDLIAWGKNVNGSFTVASAYNFLAGVDNLSQRFRRHLTTNVKCPRCLSQDEDLLHVFRDCCFAKNLWSHFVPSIDWLDFSQQDLHYWLVQNLSSARMGLSANNWPLTFGVILDHLWFDRNKLIFENLSSSDDGIWHRTVHSINEIKHAFGIDTAIEADRSMNHDIYIKWVPPPQDWFKLNLDGAVSTSAKLAVELRAILSHLYFSLVEEICSLAGVIPEVIWSHTWREGNLLADVFAKHALSCQVPLIEFDLVPPFASIAFFADMSGSVFRRDSHISL